MIPNLTLFLHVILGTAGTVVAFWILMRLLEKRQSENLGILKTTSIVTAVLIWLSYLIGGYYYVKFYGPRKAIILAGPIPWAHNFFMETKEHLFFILLLLSTYLPIVVYKNEQLILNRDKNIRKVIIAIVLIMVLLGVFMLGAGAVITFGVKMGSKGGV